MKKVPLKAMSLSPLEHKTGSNFQYFPPGSGLGSERLNLAMSSAKKPKTLKKSKKSSMKSDKKGKKKEKQAGRRKSSLTNNIKVIRNPSSTHSMRNSIFKDKEEKIENLKSSNISNSISIDELNQRKSQIGSPKFQNISLNKKKSSVKKSVFSQVFRFQNSPSNRKKKRKAVTINSEKNLGTDKNSSVLKPSLFSGVDFTGEE